MTTRNIMVVDDQPADRKLLQEALTQKGHEVQTYSNGLLALAAAAQSPPDLILLDVAMPELSGYEVCKRLKADAGLCFIPVIFLSVLDHPEDKVKAFQSGAADYISKPVHLEEMNARVETHLKLNELQKALGAQNQHLEEAVSLRTSELAQAHAELKLLDRAKDEFLRTISHELRTPLNGLLGASEIAFDDLSPSPENKQFRDLYDRSRQRLMSLLDDAMLLTQIDLIGEKFRSTPVSMHTVLDRAVELTNEFAQTRLITLEQPLVDVGYVRGHLDLLVRAFQALLETGVKLSQQGGTLRLTHEVAPGSLKVILDSDGRSLPATAHANFFEVFSVSQQIAAGEDLGLGPPVAARILSLFGGTVTVANRNDSGIRMTVEFR